MLIESRRDRAGRWLAGCLFAALLAVAGFKGYLNGVPSIQNPDEIIPMRVVQHMAATHTLDTDWANANIPDFAPFHYNFSGYNIANYGIVRATAPSRIPDDGALLDALRMISAAASALTLVLVFLLGIRLAGFAAGMYAAVAFFFFPQIFQEAHYARPEAMSTLIVAACFLLATLSSRRRAATVGIAVLIGTLVGFATSFKFTYAIVATLALIPAWKAAATFAPPRQWHVLAAVAAASGCAFGVGFVLGTPGVISHAGVYLEGLRALQQQYSHGHPPYSLQHFSLTGQAALIGSYYVATLGLATLLLHPFGYVGPRHRPVKLIFLGCLTLNIVVFITQKAFFERNLSVYAPMFCAINAAGLVHIVRAMFSRLATMTPRVGYLAACLTSIGIVAITLHTPTQVTRRMRHEFDPTFLDRRMAKMGQLDGVALRASGGTRIAMVGYADVFRQNFPVDAECVVYRMTDYGDDWSKRFRSGLSDSYQIVGELPTEFPEIPASTVHTYHSASYLYFVSKAACQGG